MVRHIGFDPTVTPTFYASTFSVDQMREGLEAGTWGVVPNSTWSPAYRGGDIQLTNGNTTASVYQNTDWANNSVASVTSHTVGKHYFEGVVSGNPGSGYMRIGVAQNQGSSFNTTIQSNRMGVWGSGVPAYANKSESNSETNTGEVSDGSQTHSDGDVFMWAFDIDNARAYFGRNGTWDLSFDPVNSTGGYDMSSLSGYVYGYPWHIIYQHLDIGDSFTLRDVSSVQYLPSGYSYWG